jgi:hypothetical protein
LSLPRRCGMKSMPRPPCRWPPPLAVCPRRRRPRALSRARCCASSNR